MQTGKSGYYSIKIEDVGYDLTNLVSEIIMTEHIEYLVPTCSLKMIDIINVFNNELALRDGTRLTIKMGMKVDDARTYKFRVFETKYATDNHNTTWFVNCILDCPLYTHQVLNLCVNGTSDKAIQTISNKVGLAVKSTATADNQKWLCFGQTAATSVQRIADHGRIDENSCMVLALTASGVLLYKNLVDVAKTSSSSNMTTLHVNTVKEQELQVNQIVFTSNSGFRNAWTGYAHKRFFDGICGSTSVKNVKPVFDSKGLLNINQDLLTAIPLSRLDTDDFVTGNVHKQYQTAYYQNIRLRSAYNVFADVLFLDDNTSLNLLDPVFLDIEDIKRPDEPAEGYGKWIVASRTVVVKSGYVYGERLTLMRNWLMNEGLTNLVRA